MKKTKIVLVMSLSIVVWACGSSKKTVSTNNVTTAATPTPMVITKPSNGVYAPGEEEVKALQSKYPEVNLSTLNMGHYLYTEGACINCHNAKNIYVHTEEEWKVIMDDMAKKASLSEKDKDAVYKYVLSIKATQSK